MVTISFKGLRSSNRGLVPWYFACPTLIWVAWGKKCLNVLQGEDFRGYLGYHLFSRFVLGLLHFNF